MLTISDSAAQGLRSLLAAVSPGEQAGVRISGCGDRATGYDLAPAAAPLPGDRTLDGGGVRVYVEPAAAPGLDDKLLDARVERGALRFALEETSGSVSARSDEDRRRFTEERRRVEQAEEPQPDEDEPTDGPGEDAVREAQRDLGDAPPEAD